MKVKNDIYRGFKMALVRLISGFILSGFLALGILLPSITFAETSKGICLLSSIKEGREEAVKIAKKLSVVITAYSSTPDQTDDTPFITASEKTVADGIVANNLLPFGAKIKIPELYGDKVFVVEDRMHPRKGYYHVDIWFPEYQQAKESGAKYAYIEVLK